MAMRVCKLPNAQEINEMSSNEIREHIKEYRSAMITMNGKNKAQGLVLDNPSQIRHTKRTIARMITVLIRRGERVVNERSRGA